jgi:chemotaxis protein CheX
MTNTPSAYLRLAPVLDLKAATDLAGELLALRGRDLAIDAANVRRIGAQCLQVLLVARASWAADGHQLSFSEASEDFREGVALLGAGDMVEAAAV